MHKNKTFYAKNNKVKSQLKNEEKIFATYITNKRLISLIYKEYFKIKWQRIKNSIVKMEKTEMALNI